MKRQMRLRTMRTKKAVMEIFKKVTLDAKEELAILQSGAIEISPTPENFDNEEAQVQ